MLLLLVTYAYYAYAYAICIRKTYLLRFPQCLYYYTLINGIRLITAQNKVVGTVIIFPKPLTTRG